MACRPYNTGRCLQLRLFNCPNFGVHFKPVLINGIAYTGQIRQMYDILKTFDYDVRALASVYQYYRLFSQIRDTYLVTRIFNYKKNFTKIL